MRGERSQKGRLGGRWQIWPFLFCRKGRKEGSLEDTGDMVVTEGLPCWGGWGKEQRLEIWNINLTVLIDLQLNRVRGRRGGGGGNKGLLSSSMRLANIAQYDFGLLGFFSLGTFIEHLLSSKTVLGYGSILFLVWLIWKKQIDFSSMEFQFGKIKTPNCVWAGSRFPNKGLHFPNARKCTLVSRRYSIKIFFS